MSDQLVKNMVDQIFVNKMMNMSIDEFLDKENCQCEGLCECDE